MNLDCCIGHAGDVTWCLVALRRIPGPHTIYCNPEYIPNLTEMCEGRDIILCEGPAPAGTPSGWIGSQRFQSRGIVWQNNPDIIEFLMRWNNALFGEAGCASQFTKRQDLLAEFPAIARHHDAPEFDVLICNCQPRSGQAPRWDQGEMDTLIEAIAQKHRVLCTNPTTAPSAQVISATICQIGNLAMRAKFVVAVASGCHWGIHSVWSQHVPKYIFAEPYVLNYGGSPMPHHGLVLSGMLPQLKQDKWL